MDHSGESYRRTPIGRAIVGVAVGLVVLLTIFVSALWGRPSYSAALLPIIIFAISYLSRSDPSYRPDERRKRRAFILLLALLAAAVLSGAVLWDFSPPHLAASMNQ